MPYQSIICPVVGVAVAVLVLALLALIIKNEG